MNCKKPLISVIIPVYKVEKFLPICINSFINQTFHDFELVIIDDGSPDNSGRICDEYASRDSRLSVYHTENRGVAAARNYGLDKAKGDFIAFTDSDDYVMPEYLQTLYNDITTYKTDAAFCNYKEIKQDGTVIRYRNETYQSGVRIADTAAILKDISDGKGVYWTVIWLGLYRRDMIGKIRFKAMHYSDDSYFMLKLLETKPTITINNYCGYVYIRYENSITMNGGNYNIQRESDHLIVESYRYSFFNKLSADLRRQPLLAYAWNILRFGCSCAMSGSKGKIRWGRQIAEPYLKEVLSDRLISGRIKNRLMLYKVVPHFYSWLCVFINKIKKR